MLRVRQHRALRSGAVAGPTIMERVADTAVAPITMNWWGAQYPLI
jgi:hypothetical protein